MAKPRGNVQRTTTPTSAILGPLGEPKITIAAWCPDEKAEQPPEQVHLVHIIPGLEEIPLVVRFKSPDTLGFLIEELTRYRREVWPDSEPVQGEPICAECSDELSPWCPSCYANHIKD